VTAPWRAICHRAVALVSLLFPGILCARTARAEAPPPPSLELMLADCVTEPFSYAELRAKLALFLRREGVTLAEPGEHGSLRATLSWPCAPGIAAARLDLGEAGLDVVRRIDLADITASDRPAVLALAVSETLRALRALAPPPAGPFDAATESAAVTPPATGTASPAATGAPGTAAPPPATPVLASETSVPGRPPPASVDVVSPAPSSGTLGLALGGDAQGFASSPVLLGARIEGRYRRLHLGLGALTAVAHDALGSATITLLRAGASLDVLALGDRPASLAAGPFVHLGGVVVHGSAGASGSGGEASDVYLAGGARVNASWSPVPALSFGVSLEAGLARGSIARADARTLAKIDGPFLGGTVFVEARP